MYTWHTSKLPSWSSSILSVAEFWNAKIRKLSLRVFSKLTSVNWLYNTHRTRAIKSDARCRNRTVRIKNRPRFPLRLPPPLPPPANVPPKFVIQTPWKAFFNSPPLSFAFPPGATGSRGADHEHGTTRRPIAKTTGEIRQTTVPDWLRFRTKHCKSLGFHLFFRWSFSFAFLWFALVHR